MIYFVTENYLKTVGVITHNVDTTDFSPLVQYCAKAFIKRMLGSYFFNDLLTKYNNQTLNTYETELVERMQLAICWRTVAQSCITLTYQLKNKGLQRQRDDNSDSVDIKEVSFMYDNYIQQAILFEKEMKDFLIDNKDNYPNYTTNDNKDSSIKKDQYNAKGDQFNEGVGLIII